MKKIIFSVVIFSTVSFAQQPERQHPEERQFASDAMSEPSQQSQDEIDQNWDLAQACTLHAHTKMDLVNSLPVSRGNEKISIQQSIAAVSQLLEGPCRDTNLINAYGLAGKLEDQKDIGKPNPNALAQACMVVQLDLIKKEKQIKTLEDNDIKPSESSLDERDLFSDILLKGPCEGTDFGRVQHQADQMLSDAKD